MSSCQPLLVPYGCFPGTHPSPKRSPKASGHSIALSPQKGLTSTHKPHKPHQTPTLWVLWPFKSPKPPQRSLQAPTNPINHSRHLHCGYSGHSRALNPHKELTSTPKLYKLHTNSYQASTNHTSPLWDKPGRFETLNQLIFHELGSE